MKRFFLCSIFLGFILLALVACDEGIQTHSTLQTAVQQKTTVTPVQTKLAQTFNQNTPVPKTIATPTPTPLPVAQADAVAQFYQAIEKQNYDQAFSYMDANVVDDRGQKFTQETFLALAQTSDKVNGVVTKFQALAHPDDPSQVTVSVVRKSGLLYYAHLQWKQEDDGWKIVQIDAV